MKKMSKSISDLIMEYFRNHPKQDLSHGIVVDWVRDEYLKNHSTPPRDTWRAIRGLYQEGKLIKVKKGIYRFDPEYIKKVEVFDFSSRTREEILKRDNYSCVVCRRGEKEGVEICADHIKSKDKGGTNSVDNGQTLCTEHNLIKKNFSQTEAGKRYCIKLYEMAVKKGDIRFIQFCKDIFDVYNSHKINRHIPRPNNHD
ncbi:hypothetical protein ES702_07798 [subsurface metagenome]